MDRVIAPHSIAVERAVRPIKDNVLADKKNTHSHEQRRRGERPVAVLVESNQSVCGGYSEQKRGADDQHGNAKVASDDWDEKPVAQVRDEIALAPPRPSRIAGPEPREYGEDNRQSQRNRDILCKGLAKADEEDEQFLIHIAAMLW